MQHAHLTHFGVEESAWTCNAGRQEDGSECSHALGSESMSERQERAYTSTTQAVGIAGRFTRGCGGQEALHICTRARRQRLAAEQVEHRGMAVTLSSVSHLIP